jgi:hypothetical protein
MATIVTRAGKGSALTHNEVDANFNNLNNAKYESGNNVTFGTIEGSTITATTAFSGALNGTVGATTPAAGTFTNLAYTGTLTGGTGVINIGSGQVYKDASGNVGIGITNPSAVLHLNRAGSTEASVKFTNGGGASSGFVVGANSTGAGLVYHIDNQPVVFATNNAERMRITDAGNVGIGTTNPTSPLTIDNNALGTTAGDVKQWIRLNTTTNNGDTLLISKYRISNGSDWTTAGSRIQQLVDSTYHAYMQFNGNNSEGISFGTGGNANPLSVQERMRIDSSGNVTISGGSVASYGSGVTTGSNPQINARGGYSSQPVYSFWFDGDTGMGLPAGGVLNFSTSNTERMRIDSSGNLLVGTTSATARFVVTAASNSAFAGQIRSDVSGDVANAPFLVAKFDNDSTTSQVFQRFAINAGGAASGQINANGASQAAFGSWSDARLKENIEPLSPQLDNILALNPSEFDYIESEGGGHQIGFIAQEMQEIYPDAVGERADGMLSVTGWSKTEARLVKAIQELSAKVDTLQAELNTLKGN